MDAHSHFTRNQSSTASGLVQTAPNCTDSLHRVGSVVSINSRAELRELRSFDQLE